MIQELTQTQTKIKIIEQEDMSILLEHGKYVSAALISEDNLITLRTKLIESIRKIEDFYENIFEHYEGNISVFSEIGDIVQDIFDI